MRIALYIRLLDVLDDIDVQEIDVQNICFYFISMTICPQ